MHSAAAAYSAAAVGVLYAGISAYWAAGGTALLTAAGNAVEPHARTGAALVAAVWLTVAVKLAVSALGVLAIVRSGSSHRPRRLLRVLTWVAAIVLMLYGTVLTAVGVAVESGLVRHGAHADLTALRWHAFLWDPWFLLWDCS